jgi:hypothetical protein
VAAIGYTVPLAPELRRAFDPAAFEPMPEPDIPRATCVSIRG